MKQKIITVVLCCFGLVFMIPAVSWGLGLDNPADRAGSWSDFEFVFPEVSLQVENNLINSDFLNADRTPVFNSNYYLNRMEGQPLRTNVKFDLGTGITIGDFTFHTGLWGGESINLADGLTRLNLNREPNKTYDITGTFANSLVALSRDLTYARTIPLIVNDLQVGVTFRQLEGIAVSSGEVTVGQITTTSVGQIHYDFSVQSFGTPKNNNNSGGFRGEGYLVDLGANYVVDKWKFGLALKNLGPPMKWSGIDIKNDQYVGVITDPENPGIIAPSYPDQQTGCDYSVNIPVVLEAGASYKLKKNLALQFGLSTALSDGFGYSRTMRFLGDAEWAPCSFLNLAGEIYFQGDQIGVDTLTELRLGSLWMDLGLGWTGGLLPDKGTTGVNASVSTRICI